MDRRTFLKIGSALPTAVALSGVPRLAAADIPAANGGFLKSQHA